MLISQHIVRSSILHNDIINIVLAIGELGKKTVPNRMPLYVKRISPLLVLSESKRGYEYHSSGELRINEQHP